MKGDLKVNMLSRYLVKFFIRILIFACVFAFYIADKPRMYMLVTQPLWKEVSLIHLLWLVFMVMMLRHIFPGEKRTMALLKAEKAQYVERQGYSETGLFRYIQKQNGKAWMVMLVWLCFNAVFGLLYSFEILDNADLLMLTVFYFLCDYICILLFCPFQTFMMGNKCCVNCRIYEWGHFMMFTPMLFIRNFFSWSLFFTSCIVLIRWEIIYARYPERFWEGSNQSLQCMNCNDKICQIKRKIHKNAESTSSKNNMN